MGYAIGSRRWVFGRQRLSHFILGDQLSVLPLVLCSPTELLNSVYSTSARFDNIECNYISLSKLCEARYKKSWPPFGVTRHTKSGHYRSSLLAAEAGYRVRLLSCLNRFSGIVSGKNQKCWAGSFQRRASTSDSFLSTDNMFARTLRPMWPSRPLALRPITQAASARRRVTTDAASSHAEDVPEVSGYGQPFCARQADPSPRKMISPSI
jgi:hypothetical protein